MAIAQAHMARSPAHPQYNNPVARETTRLNSTPLWHGHFKLHSWYSVESPCPITPPTVAPRSLSADHLSLCQVDHFSDCATLRFAWEISISTIYRDQRPTAINATPICRHARRAIRAGFNMNAAACEIQAPWFRPSLKCDGYAFNTSYRRFGSAFGPHRSGCPADRACIQTDL